MLSVKEVNDDKRFGVPKQEIYKDQISRYNISKKCKAYVGCLCIKEDMLLTWYYLQCMEEGE